jgi:hypothetical protein
LEPEVSRISNIRGTLLQTVEASYGVDEVQRMIAEGILREQPFLVARFGSTEFRSTWRYRIRRDSNPFDIFRLEFFQKQRILWTKKREYELHMTSGFFPLTHRATNRFGALMEEAMEHVDVLGSWVPGEIVFARRLSNATPVDLSFLEPFFASDPWTMALQEKRVLVVHPFVSSIISQYPIRRKLFSTPVLPDFDLVTYRAVQTGGGQTLGYKTWFDALDKMVHEISEIDFDVALVGCGAYGFPLAAALKRLGKKAIHLGGSLQLLFGIRGKRWDALPEYRALVNDHWIRPLAEDTHSGYQHMEGGAYW